jgi:hypothetical protein
MPMDDDDKKARDRLLVYTAMRLGGLALVLMGIAIIYTDWLRPGGWPQLGAIVVILGAIDSVVAPMLMRRVWEKQDQEGR